MAWFASAVNHVFDLLVAPFGGAAGWAMAVLSALCGVGLLWLFKVSTNQAALAAARNRALGHVYELGIYQEDFGVMLRIQRDLAAANLGYLRRALPALAAMIVPILLILPQLDARWSRRPLAPGEAVVVTATVAPGREALLGGLTLTGSDGVAVETPAVRDRAARTAQWRVRVKAPGARQIVTVRAGGGPGGGPGGNPGGADDAWTKRVEAGRGIPRIAAVRERASLRAALFNPAEPPLPAGAPLESIALELPARETRYLGLAMNWLVAFCVFSIVGGLAAKRWIKVEI